MPTKIFTETWLKALLKKAPPPKAVPYSEPGRVGFLLQHKPGGSLVWLARYQRAGAAVWLKLGNYPGLSLEQAHDAHSEVRKQLSRGLDPKEERDRHRVERARQEERRRRTDAVSARNVIAEWAWHYARRHRKRPREAVRLLKVHLLKSPTYPKAAHEISKRDLVMVIDRVLARGSTVMANRMRDLVVQVFGFAAERDLIPSSPAAGLRRKPGGQEESKERSLSRDEIKAAWKGLQDPEAPISTAVRLGLKLILVTLQRPGEVASAKVEHFDLKKRVWTIPAEVAKNEREHLVPLTDLAVELIEQLVELANGRPHLMPSVHSKRKPNAPVSERALSRALKNNHAGGRNPKLFGVDPFTPHDLRRTGATQMTSLGVPRLHVKKVINHSDDETTAIYDRHHYWAEKEHALKLWEAELRTIVSGARRTVVPLPSAKVRAS